MKSVAQAKINLVEFIDDSNVRPTKNGERQSLTFLKCSDKHAKFELTVDATMIDESNQSQMTETINLDSQPSLGLFGTTMSSFKLDSLFSASQDTENSPAYHNILL